VGSDRIVVTHAGSLVRPSDLIPFLRAIDRGEPYDADAHERCLSDSVRDVVARQREAGAAGTDCGFAQGPYIHRVHPSIMWAKLAALAEGAALATEREFA